MAFPTQPVIDTCTRADENPLAFGGRWLNGISSLKIASNRLRADTGEGLAGWVNIAASPDVEAYIRMDTAPTNAGEQFYFFARMTSAASISSGYAVRFDKDANRVAVLRIDSGALTTLAADFAPTGDGGGFGFSITGNVLQRYYYDGAWHALDAVTDGTYPNAGYFSMYTNNNSGRYSQIGAGPVSSVLGGGGSVSATGGIHEPLLGRGIGRGFGWR